MTLTWQPWHDCRRRLSYARHSADHGNCPPRRRVSRPQARTLGDTPAQPRAVKRHTVYVCTQRACQVDEGALRSFRISASSSGSGNQSGNTERASSPTRPPRRRVSATVADPRDLESAPGSSCHISAHVLAAWQRGDVPGARSWLSVESHAKDDRNNVG
jgi:hypothetical protein